MCEKSGDRIVESDELLYRCVFPAWIEEGTVSSQAFDPFRKDDDGCLSMDRGSMCTAADAFARFNATLTDPDKPKAAGVWGVTVGEAEAAALEAWNDPQTHNPTHALIEFGDTKVKHAKKALKAHAVARGPLHFP